MAYGVLHGSGISLYDLYSLAKDIAEGNIGLPLASRDGSMLAARNGEAILAWNPLYGEGSVLESKIYAVQSDRIRGLAAAPLLTADGKEIADRNGTAIFAYSVQGGQERGNGREVTEAVAGVMRVVDANRRECLEGLYELTASLIRGTAVAPLLAANGEQICDRGRVALAAVRHF